MGNAYHLIIHDADGKVIRQINNITEVEVDGNTVRHKKGEIRDIKYPFIVVDDAFVGKKFKKGETIDTEILQNDEKTAKHLKEKKLEGRLKALEDRIAKMEGRLPKT